MMHFKDREKKKRVSGNENHSTNIKLLEDIKLARSAKNDRKAAESIIKRLAPRVQQAVYLAVGYDQEADDLINICLIQILENLNHYKGVGPLEAWAGRLTYRVLMRQLSRRRRSERTVSLIPDEPIVEITSNPEKKIAITQLRERLISHLQKLPEERRITLILRMIHQYSVSEVAELTEAPVNTVRDRIRVGLKEMRKYILNDKEVMAYLKVARND
jgi:RNA polymerase sigma-70 factor (ECF subfamily)